MEQHFKVEDLERWIEQNRRAREEKRWGAYREQKIEQLDRKKMENEARWVKKDDKEDEKWAKCQKIVDEIKRKDDEMRNRENIKKAEDDRKWDVYRKHFIEEMKREEVKVKAENKAVDDKWWEEYKKQMFDRKESERKCTEDNLMSVNEVFAEFQELVQSKHADIDLSENCGHCSISQRRIMKEYFTADTSAQEESWTDYRKLLKGIEREKNMTSAKKYISHKTEDLRGLQEKYCVVSRTMVARSLKEDKGARRLQEICKDVQDQVFSDFEEIIEGKKGKVLTEGREKRHYQDLKRQIEEQLKFETKKQGEDRKGKDQRVVKLVDRKWAEYRKRLIEEFDRQEKLALKAEVERNAEEERWWEEIKKMVAEKDKEEKARAGIEEILAEYQELADCMEKM